MRHSKHKLCLPYWSYDRRVLRLLCDATDALCVCVCVLLGTTDTTWSYFNIMMMLEKLIFAGIEIITNRDRSSDET